MADENQNGAGSGEGEGSAGSGDGTQTPAGFVPQADLEREQARARSFQSELDRAKADLARAQAAGSNGTGTEGKGEGEGVPSGLDPAELRRSILGDVINVTRMAQAVTTLQTQFPQADPAIYDRLDQFGSADALRVAVEDSHRRVESILAADRAATEARLREEFAGKLGGGTPAGGATGLTGDPTVEQLAALSVSELNELENKSPGVTARVLRSAG